MPLSWDPECSWTPTLERSLPRDNELNCILVFIQCEQGYKTCHCYFHFPQMRSLLAAWASPTLQPKIRQVSLNLDQTRRGPHATTQQARLVCGHQKHSCATETMPPCTKNFSGTKIKNPLGWHHSHLGGSSYQLRGESRACCPPPRHVPACILIWKQQW